MPSLDIEVIHQVFIIAFQLVLISLFPKIVFHIVFETLQGGNDVGYFKLIDAQDHNKFTGSRNMCRIQLGYIGVIGFNQTADLTEREVLFFHRKHDQRAFVVGTGKKGQLFEQVLLGDGADEVAIRFHHRNRAQLVFGYLTECIENMVARSGEMRDETFLDPVQGRRFIAYIEQTFFIHHTYKFIILHHGEVGEVEIRHVLQGQVHGIVQMETGDGS